MSLRTRKKGHQRPWSLEELRAGLEHFSATHHRYPTSAEVDSYGYLPTSRSIQRQFGGLVHLRGKLKLAGQGDFRTGEYSAQRARNISRRAHRTEREVYEFLKDRFGKEFVHREYFFTDDRRTRADFFVYDTGKGFCVDVFHPRNRFNLIGCLNSKLDKYRSEQVRHYPVIFLQMNRELPQRTLDGVLVNKKKKLSRGQYLMGWKTFEVFCSERKRLNLKLG